MRLAALPAVTAALAAVILLAGCGVPDLVAHTVKAVERSQRDGAAAPAAPAPRASPSSQVAAPAPPDEPPPPATMPPPRRSTVTVEELPAR